MPNRTLSNMTAHQFNDWCGRHGVSKWNCITALGISYTQYYKYRNGTAAIPLTIQLLCELHDTKAELKSLGVSVNEMASICASTERRR